MFINKFPDKDCTITDVTIHGVSKVLTNSGASEILELFSLTSSSDSVGKSRILLQFDVSSLSSSIASGEIPISATFRLQLKSAPHSETVPYGFDLEVCPLSQSWIEGRGLSNYDEGMVDRGVSNWSKRNLIDNWSISGSSYFSSSNLTSSQYFNTGFENLDCDISNIVRAWTLGTIPNNGLIVKYSPAYENLNEDLYIKKFFSRNAHATERTPRLFVGWDDSIQDDRANIKYNVSGSLFYYRNINGILSDVSSNLFVNIMNSSSVVQTLTASRVRTGVYAVSGVLVAPTNNGPNYTDVWFNGATQHFTGAFRANYESGSASPGFDSITLNIPNLNTFTQGTKSVLRVFARQKDYRPAIASYAGQNPEPVLLKDAYYQIQDAETEEIVVDFSTGSVKYSKLSYDKDGNYFLLDTNSLRPEYVYKIKIMMNWADQIQIFDRDLLFKIEL